jgi:hypothetical protein
LDNHFGDDELNGTNKGQFSDWQVSRLVRLYLLFTQSTPNPVLLESLLTAAAKYPHITDYIPETLDANATRSAELLGLTKCEFVTTALKRLPLLTLSPETLGDNVRGSAAVLGIGKALFVAAARQQPTLFVSRPDTISAKWPRIEAVADALGQTTTPDEVLRRCPVAFVSAPNTLHLRYILAKNGHGKSLPQLVRMPARQAEDTAIAIYHGKNRTLRVMYAKGLIKTLPDYADLTKTPEPVR